MVQRVTNTTMTRILNADIQSNARRLLQAQQKISSGKQLQRPSDGPANVLHALDQRAELRRYEQYGRNAADAAAWIGSTDSTLATVVERLQRVRSLVLEGVNGSIDQTARDAVAAEIEGIRGELVALANTSYLGRPLFVGVVDTEQAFDPVTGDYLGDSGAVTRTIAPGTTIQVNLPGDEVFGTYDAGDPKNGNLFQVIDQLVADIRAGDIDEMRAGIDRLDDAVARIELAQAETGSRGRRLESLDARNGDVMLDIRANLSEVEDVDYAKALIELRSQEFAYEAALSVTARIIQPSLLDFLR
ncbi:MAG TPA: flagellar hook-associated protein FlgL [Acidimicrobiales bacterium]